MFLFFIITSYVIYLRVPKSIGSKLQPEQLSIKRKCKSAFKYSSASYSAIGQRVLENKDCAIHYNDKQFSILPNGRSHIHLSTFEAIYIKILKPELCRQKGIFLYFENSALIIWIFLERSDSVYESGRILYHVIRNLLLLYKFFSTLLSYHSSKNC